MPTPTKGPRLGGSPAHERLLLANLATALFEHDAITTTQAKAKRLRPLAEKLVTQAKQGSLHARRQVRTVVRDNEVVTRLFDEIAPRYTERPGGYTRITKLGPRKGDNAPMARIELVEALTVAQTAVGEAERARGTRFARGGAVDASVPAAAAPAEPVSDADATPGSELTPTEDFAAEATAGGAADEAAPAEAAPDETPAAEAEVTDFAVEATTGGPVDAEDTPAEGAESAPEA